jgi:hypothetical protein
VAGRYRESVVWPLLLYDTPAIVSIEPIPYQHSVLKV